MPTTRTTTTKTTGRRARRRQRRRARNPRARNGNFNQNLGTDVLWFKTVGDITGTGSGTLYLPSQPNDVFPIPSFVNMCRSWEQYKVLKVIVKFYPAYIGSETSTAAPAGFRRGNTVTWVDQPPLQAQPVAGQIATVMGFPSAKLHNSRATIKRWINRPSGGRFLDWAYVTHPTATGLPVVAPDAWGTRINLFGDDFSASGQSSKPYYFYEQLFKVVFRSRYRGGPP